MDKVSYGGEPMPNGKLTAAREPVSMEILYQARDLAERSGKLAGRVHGQLAPVMAAIPAIPEPCGTGCIQREYPPLFEDLRSQFFAIERALSSIENAMGRVEL